MEQNVSRITECLLIIALTLRLPKPVKFIRGNYLPGLGPEDETINQKNMIFNVLKYLITKAE